MTARDGNYTRTLPFVVGDLLLLVCLLLYAISCLDGVWFHHKYPINDDEKVDVPFAIGQICSSPQGEIILCPTKLDAKSPRPGWATAACVIILIAFILLLAASLWATGIGLLFGLILTERTPPRIHIPEVMSAAGSVLGFAGTMVFVAGTQATFESTEIVYDWGFAVSMTAAITCLTGVPALFLESKSITAAPTEPGKGVDDDATPAADAEWAESSRL